MELEEFEKEMKQDANAVDESALAFETDKQPEAAGNVEAAADVEEAPAHPAPVTMKLGDFGNIIVGAYCKLSDVVFTKVKKRPAPAWEDDTKKMLSEALTPVLQQYNIPVTPLTGLIGTVAMVEFMRYTNLNVITNGNETETL